MLRLATLALLVMALRASAQQQMPPLKPSNPVADTSIFAPLKLPAGDLVRTGSGAPGARYWQNRADYDIRASLDTAARTLRGELTLRYTNNSPDTLHYIWIQTEQNAFRDNSLNSLIFPPNSRFGAKNFQGGDVFDRFEQVLAGAAKAAPRRVKLQLRDNETTTKVDL